MRGEKECTNVIASHLANGDDVNKQRLIEDANKIAHMNAYRG